MESRVVSWRGKTWPTMCERISSSHFICHDFAIFDGDMEPDHLDPNLPAELELDGVPCASVKVNVDKYACVQLDVELTSGLPLIEFTPYREFPQRTGDTTYAVAFERASAEHSVDVAAIRETADYWVFPVFQIGCCGVLVEKATGKLVEFGSRPGLDDWIWGYEKGLLHEPPRDLVVISVRDAEATLRALKHFIRQPNITALPATFEGCAFWMAITPLREAGDAFVWQCS